MCFQSTRFDDSPESSRFDRDEEPVSSRPFAESDLPVESTRTVDTGNASEDPLKTDPFMAAEALNVVTDTLDLIPGASSYVANIVGAKVLADPALVADPIRLLATFEEVIKASPYNQEYGDALFISMLLGGSAGKDDFLSLDQG